MPSTQQQFRFPSQESGLSTCTCSDTTQFLSKVNVHRILHQIVSVTYSRHSTALVAIAQFNKHIAYNMCTNAHAHVHTCICTYNITYPMHAYILYGLQDHNIMYMYFKVKYTYYVGFFSYRIKLIVQSWTQCHMYTCTCVS